jgi:hypothetical protein
MAEQIDSADLVVGVLSEFDPNTIAKMCDELRTVPRPLRIAVCMMISRQARPQSPETPRKAAHSCSLFLCFCQSRRSPLLGY